MTAGIRQCLRSAALSALFLMAGAGCDGYYTFSTICDYAVFGDDLYVLAIREDGIDRASRFAHSAAVTPTRHVLAIARCSIKEAGAVVFEPIAVRECSDDRFLLTSTYLLCSADSFGAFTTPGVFEVLSLQRQVNTERQAKNADRKLKADHVAFSTGRSALIGCGSNSWVLEMSSLEDVSPSRSSALLAPLCNTWRDTLTSRAVISKDLGVLARSETGPAMTTLTVTALDGRSRSTVSVFSNMIFTVHDVCAEGDGARVLASFFESNNREIAMVLDSNGKEIGRTEIFGVPVSDGELKTVVSIFGGHSAYLRPGSNVAVKVWLPSQGREFKLSVDASELLADLERGTIETAP